VPSSCHPREQAGVETDPVFGELTSLLAAEPAEDAVSEEEVEPVMSEEDEQQQQQQQQEEEEEEVEEEEEGQAEAGVEMVLMSIECPEGIEAGDQLVVGTEWGEEVEIIGQTPIIYIYRRGAAPPHLPPHAMPCRPPVCRVPCADARLADGGRYLPALLN
jgi:hypothetical protein